MTPNSTPDYSAFQEKPSEVAEGPFKALNGLVEQAMATENEVDRLAKELAASQEKLRDLTWRQIPTMMDDMGVKDFTTAKGMKIDVKEEVHAAIPEAERPTAFAWLEQNGHGGMIKRELSVAFNKNQQEAADTLKKELMGKFAAVAEKKAVHPSTLKAWVKEMLGAGKSFPLDTFGVFRQRVAKITTK